MAAVTTSGERVGRSPWAAATNCGDRETLESALQLVRGTEGELAHLSECLDARSSGRALGDDEDPDGLDRAVPALGRSLGPARENGPGGLDGVEGIGLAAVVSSLAVLAVDFDDVDAGSGEEAGDARPVGPRPFHPDFSDVSEIPEPRHQGGVAVGIGRERCGSEQATDVVQGGGHVNLPMGVDTTSDGACGFYDGHAIPSFP